MTQGHAPGWYPDPEYPGTLRYWDGQAWTAHRAPGMPGQGPPGYVPQVRRGPRAWVIAVAVLVPLLGVGGCLSALVLFSGQTSSSCGPGESTARDLSTYRAVSERDYAQIVKEPDAHVGEKIIIYGVVTQFDSATGPKSLLANTSARPKRAWFAYDTNTVVDAPSLKTLSDVVKDDLVKMHVEVLGATSYDTQIGGNTTAPRVCVRAVEVTGHGA